MKKIWKRKMDEEGEMGVGALLIFIAMILVAAVAASVLDPQPRRRSFDLESRRAVEKSAIRLNPSRANSNSSSPEGSPERITSNK